MIIKRKELLKINRKTSPVWERMACIQREEMTTARKEGKNKAKRSHLSTLFG